MTGWKTPPGSPSRCVHRRCCIPPGGRSAGFCSCLHVTRVSMTGNPSRSFHVSTWPTRSDSIIGIVPFLWQGCTPFIKTVLQWQCQPLLWRSWRTCWALSRGSRAAHWGCTALIAWCHSPRGPWLRSLQIGRRGCQWAGVSGLQSILWMYYWWGRSRYLWTPSWVDCRGRRPHFGTCRIANICACVLRGVFLVNGYCPFWYGGRLTRVVWEDETDWADEHVLRHRQDEAKAAVLLPSTGNIDWRHILGNETMGVLDGCTLQIPRMLGTEWQR